MADILRTLPTPTPESDVQIQKPDPEQISTPLPTSTKLRYESLGFMAESPTPGQQDVTEKLRHNLPIGSKLQVLLCILEARNRNVCHILMPIVTVIFSIVLYHIWALFYMVYVEQDIV